MLSDIKESLDLPLPQLVKLKIQNQQIAVRQLLKSTPELIEVIYL
jgi:hypothetical protein